MTLPYVGIVFAIGMIVLFVLGEWTGVAKTKLLNLAYFKKHISHMQYIALRTLIWGVILMAIPWFLIGFKLLFNPSVLVYYYIVIAYLWTGVMIGWIMVTSGWGIILQLIHMAKGKKKTTVSQIEFTALNLVIFVVTASVFLLHF